MTGQILRPVLALSVVERLRVLAHPLVALPLWAADLYFWHIPYLYDAALHHKSVHALEHFGFFTCGCLMWEPVLETLPAPAWFGTGLKLGYIAVVRLIETILGNVFIWSRARSTACTGTRRSGASRPSHDLNLGGIVMMAEGSVVTLAALVWLFLSLPRRVSCVSGCSSRGSTRGRCSARFATAAPRDLGASELPASGGSSRRESPWRRAV